MVRGVLNCSEERSAFHKLDKCIKIGEEPIILPEYWACRKCIYEGAMGTDAWGNSVQCFGDSKAFGEVIVQFWSFLGSGVTAALIIISLRACYLKRNAKK